MSDNSNDPIALQVRMTEALRAKLATAAEGNGRSLNSEILWRLNQSFDERNERREELRKIVDKILDERGIKRRPPLVRRKVVK
jgi:Arc-like DNA binding domain